MPLRAYGLPTPPSNRRLPASRQSAVQRLMSRVAAARAARPRRRRPRPSVKLPPPTPPRKYTPTQKPSVKTKRETRGPVRDILSIIADAARKREMVALRYKKATANDAIIYRLIEPYSLRYKMTKKRGRARYFYAYDAAGPTVGIHSFLLANIEGVSPTGRVYSPRWRVEF